ncbi:MAG TPA: aminotransferase class I/II-fold pyridoxal phosphate-dependent enzyme [Paracoccaceae bacterium]|nr:aminotransferase class I/II-fold pyridoxal phosphate-dependent enzyme [Paracoccaceae bacterium]
MSKVRSGTQSASPVFAKPFTGIDPIPETAIARAVALMRSGRLHRYDLAPGELGPVAELESAVARWLGVPHALAVTSGGQAMQIALRAAGVGPGDRVLTNAFTLAPVPGAIAAVGAAPVLVESDANLRPDLPDMASKAAASGAKVLLLSNMRGHLPDMQAVADLCGRAGLVLIEDCAHTMGASWAGRPSGTWGLAGCFSTQGYKHLSSGEGGLLVTSDAEFAARATILSGSYMHYARHGAGPDEAAFAEAKFDMPNCSVRMDALRACLLIDQLATLPDRVARWRFLYRAAEAGLADLPGLTLPQRPQAEDFVGSSIQFLLPPEWDSARASALVTACAARGVVLAWFGAAEPQGFTSRFDSWRYAPSPDLPRTRALLARLCDMRLPLTFDKDDVAVVTAIIAQEYRALEGLA